MNFITFVVNFKFFLCFIKNLLRFLTLTNSNKYNMKRKFNGMLTLFLALVVQLTFAQEKTISGTVTDETGLPLPGTTVLVKGTTAGVSADFDGKYSIQASPNQILMFSFVGYATQEITVGTSNSIDVVMAEDVESLEEVVVAFRKVSRATISGSSAAIDPVIIDQTPVASVDQLLQGNVTGLNVTANNGNPGASAEVIIRGEGSPTGGSEPIFFLDGVRITGADFRALNPQDFADINVLKDGASTALYGARGGNGVILITSKKGKPGKGVIEYQGSVGYGSLPQTNLDMMNAEQFRIYRNFLDPGTYTDQEIIEARTESTNWRDVFFRDPITTNHQLSFSGGTETSSYYISGGYYSQDGIIERSGLERTSLRVNLSNDVKDWLTIGTNFTVSYASEKLADDFGVNTNSPITQAFFNEPDRPAFNDDGSINNNVGFGFNALEQTRLNFDKRNQIKIVGDVFARVNLARNFNYNLTLGIDFRESERERFFKPGTNLGDQQDEGQLLITNARNATIRHTSNFDYKLDIGDKHRFNFLLGMDFERFRNRDSGIDIQNFAFTDLGVPNGGTNPVDITGDQDNATFVNYFFNVDYTFNNKYNFTGSVSYGADSDLNALNRFDWFYGLSGSWNISREEFLVNSSWVDNLKLRASYALTGNNQSAGSYASSNFLTLDQYGGESALLSLFAINDPSISWELVTDYNIGLDFRLFNRVTGNIDVYHKETSDLTFAEPVPSSTTITGAGGGTVTRNTDDYLIVNKGVEVQLAVDVLKGDNYGITLGGNYAYNLNEVNNNGVDDDGNPIEGFQDTNLSSAWFGDGEAFGTWYLVRFAGVNPANGDALYYDADGNITNVYNEDDNSVILSGKSNRAPINGGFFGNFKWNGFELDARFSFQYDKYMSNNTRFFIENPNFRTSNQAVSMLDIWRNPGDITTIPRDGVAPQFDSRLLENASFLRLKTLTLSYNLPSKFANSVGLQGLRIFAQGQNLLTWTEYRGLDPEINSRFDGFSYPVPRTYLVGVNIKF